MLHHNILVTDNLHIACYTVADNADRLIYEATLVNADRGMLVLQLDDGTVWQCVAAATLVFVGNNLSGEGYSVDGSGTVTIKLGDAAGAQSFILADSGDATVFEIDSNGAITTYATATFGADIILDDGAGDSPNIQWVGGTNDDTAYMFLEDDAVAGDSDLVIKLVDAAGDSIFKVVDSGDAQIFSLDSNGNIVLVDGATVGQAAGPLLTFDDTLNFLEITGCDVGMGTATPTGNLDVEQAIVATGIRKGIVYTGAVNTNQTLSTEIPSVTITTAGREWATGALALQREVLITQPTYTFVGGSTITDAATVGIVGAPIESTNATLTNTHGLLIQAGAVGAAAVSYGLTVNAQTGAGANYAAQFMGGNLGVGVADPDELVELYKVGTQLKLSGGALDYATLAVAADGALTITTVDDTAAEGDILLMPDGAVGIGTLTPDRLLHAEVSDAGTNAVVYAQRLSHITSGAAVAGFGTGIEFELEENDASNRVAAYITADWEDAGEGASADGRLNFGVMTADAAAATAMCIWNGLVGMGGVVAPTGQLHIDQSDNAGTLPVIKLDQADDSEGFFDLIGNTAASAVGPISTWTVANLAGYVRCEINGAAQWLAFYDAPTA